MYYQQKSFQSNQQNRQNFQNPQSPQQNQVQGQSQGVTTKVKTPEINDRDRINDVLATEKYLSDSFNTFVREASHNSLFCDAKQILNDTHDCARDIFNVMYQQGSYNLDVAPTQKVQKTWNKFSNYLNTQAPY